MSEVPPQDARRLLPLVYDELRRMAASQLAREPAGQTLDPTDLVHEAYLRLIGAGAWASETHLKRAAAVAMRRILVDRARWKKAIEHGGDIALHELATVPGWGRRLNRELQSLHPALVEYKGLTRYRDAAVGWLARYEDGV